jgi:hypothetical protein
VGESPLCPAGAEARGDLGVCSSALDSQILLDEGQDITPPTTLLPADPDSQNIFATSSLIVRGA